MGAVLDFVCKDTLGRIFTLTCPTINQIINTVMNNQINCLKVKALDLHYTFVQSLLDFVSDVTTDGDTEGASWHKHVNDMELLRLAATGHADIADLQTFFRDGNTMMALGPKMHDIENYFHVEKGSADNFVLILTDEVGTTLYVIPGSDLEY